MQWSKNSLEIARWESQLGLVDPQTIFFIDFTEYKIAAQIKCDTNTTLLHNNVIFI